MLSGETFQRLSVICTRSVETATALDPSEVAATGADLEAAVSLRRQLHTRWIRRQASKVRDQTPALVQRWRQGEPFLDLAREVRFPPYLTARLFIEVICDIPRTKVGDAVKDPERQIADERLRGVLNEAMAADADCSPATDRVRRIVGAEYEHILQRQLCGRGLLFETEEELRNQGLAKTPDIRLLCPIAVRDPRTKRWAEVNWIDSKAMFGDPTTFETEHLPQLMGYVNRYGPGMVIYWFGFVDSLFQLTPTEPDVIVVGSLPETFLLPGVDSPCSPLMEDPEGSIESGNHDPHR